MVNFNNGIVKVMYHRVEYDTGPDLVPAVEYGEDGQPIRLENMAALLETTDPHLSEPRPVLIDYRPVSIEMKLPTYQTQFSSYHQLSESNAPTNYSWPIND